MEEPNLTDFVMLGKIGYSMYQGTHIQFVTQLDIVWGR